MKRTIFLGLLILTVIFRAYGQNNSPIDLVLLLDTSSAMSSSYENVNDYITGAFLNEYLRVGDTFHLIAFSANPRLDSARRILGAGDVETIIGRMLIQYPVESGNNVTAALSFAERYVTTLPARSKKIVLVTIGGSDTGNLVNASKQRLNSRNTTLDYIQVTPGRPLSNLPKSGRPAAVTTNRTTTTPAASTSRSPSAQTGTTQGTTAGAGTTSGTNTAGGTGAAGGTGTSAGANAAGAAGTTQGTAAGAETNAGTSGQVSSSDSAAAGQTAGTQPDKSGGSVSGTEETSSKTFDSDSAKQTKDRRESFSASLPFILFIIIMILLILGLIIFLASRRLGSSPNRVMAEVSSSSSRDNSRFADHSKDLAKYAAVQGRRSTPYEDRPLKTENYKQPVINPSGPLLLNLFVEDQNTSIGKRNIHSLKSGYGLSVGGGNADDYLIFLVPMPTHLGEIRRNGSTLTFIPKKPKYFPDVGSKEVKDCINKTIRVISDKNYEMRFRFEMYEDPLVALNRMLMSVKIPG
jgi:hypothetical protein